MTRAPRLFGDEQEHDTFIAERSIDVIELEDFACSDNAVIREGAVLGLAALRNRITAVLERLEREDPSPGVREQAKDSR